VNNIVLVGFMGSGKSTVGPLLAKRLGRPFREIDDEVVAEAGRPVTQIFANEGESGFRLREAACLARALTVGSQVIPCYKVLCFGGKAICPVSGLCPDQIVGDQQRAIGLPPGRPGATINFPFPLTIAGVDPVAEEELSGIAKCVTSGHYLQPGAGVGAD